MDFRRIDSLEQLRQFTGLVFAENKRLRQRLEKLVAENARLGGDNQQLQTELDLIAKQVNSDVVAQTPGAPRKPRRNRLFGRSSSISASSEMTRLPTTMCSRTAKSSR